MATIEDSITDDEIEDVEDAKKKSKRSKTKYGGLIED